MGLMSTAGRTAARARSRAGAGTVAIGPEGDDAAFQQVVGVGRPLLDQLVEPAQALVGLERLLLQQFQTRRRRRPSRRGGRPASRAAP